VGRNEVTQHTQRRAHKFAQAVQSGNKDRKAAACRGLKLKLWALEMRERGTRRYGSIAMRGIVCEGIESAACLRCDPTRDLFVKIQPLLYVSLESWWSLSQSLCEFILVSTTWRSPANFRWFRENPKPTNEWSNVVFSGDYS